MSQQEIDKVYEVLLINSDKFWCMQIITTGLHVVYCSDWSIPFIISVSDLVCAFKLTFSVFFNTRYRRIEDSEHYCLSYFHPSFSSSIS
jgi:hypothetical protein